MRFLEQAGCHSTSLPAPGWIGRACLTEQAEEKQIFPDINCVIQVYTQDPPTCHVCIIHVHHQIHFHKTGENTASILIMLLYTQACTLSKYKTIISYFPDT